MFIASKVAEARPVVWDKARAIEMYWARGENLEAERQAIQWRAAF